MRYILTSFLTLMLVWPLYGQDEVVQDTLDWRQYYPLEIGNVWEWKTEILVSYTGFDRRELIGDTLIEGQRYFVQSEYFTEKDLNWGIDRSGTDTTYLRYDTLRTRVVALAQEGERDYTCDLSAAFGTMISCDLFGEAYVGGGYVREGEYLSVKGKSAPYSAVKDYYNIGGGISYFHGLGMLPGLGDGNAGSIAFTYLRLSGVEYGERSVIVGVEDEEVVEDYTIELYPNPVRDQLTVEFGKPGVRLSVVIYDLLGRIVLKPLRCFGSRCRVDTSPLSPGIYFMRITGNSGRSFQKQFAVIK